MRIILAILLMASPVGADWTENNGKREWAQGRTKVMVSHELEIISWPGLPDSTYFKVDVGSITDSIWYSGDTTTIGISEFFHARFFNVGDAMLEWEAVLYQKPGNQFSWTFPFESNNLDFFYQGELTQEDIDRGAYRPDSVIGSYAVYHSSKSNNRIIINGADTTFEFYGNGKAGHWYRPKAWDAAGDTVWLDLNIDTVANEITIGSVANRQWIRQAIYPVTIDPTFGHTDVGASEVTWIQDEAYGHILAAQQYTASTGDTITKYSIHGEQNGTACGVDMVAYTFSAGAPANRLATPATITFTSGDPAAWYHSGAVTHGLSNGVVYVVCTGNKTGVNNPRFTYDNVASSGSIQFDNTLNATWSDDFT